MLTLVGHACAINPAARLRAHARREGWRIYDYRTGRKAARAGLVTGTVAGGVAGAIAAAWPSADGRRPASDLRGRRRRGRVG